MWDQTSWAGLWTANCVEMRAIFSLVSRADEQRYWRPVTSHFMNFAKEKNQCNPLNYLSLLNGYWSAQKATPFWAVEFNARVCLPRNAGWTNRSASMSMGKSKGLTVSWLCNWKHIYCFIVKRKYYIKDIKFHLTTASTDSFSRNGLQCSLLSYKLAAPEYWGEDELSN
jgi:hypothetical protein